LFEVGDSWIRLFGEDWLDGSVPLRSALELGIPVQLNSDYPVTSMNPFVGIKAAVHRRTVSGATISPGQAISVDEALRAMTVTPAYVAHNEDVAGSVSVGKWADLAVLSADPYTVPAGDLDQIDVTTTIVGGRVRYIRDGEEDGDD
jgi:predicted amidohydrolase YtcJ